MRFLQIITDTAFSYRPLRFFGAIACALLVFALAYGVEPLVHYIQQRRIEQWMFYRLSAVAVAITAAFNLTLVGLLAQQAVSLIHEDFRASGWLHHFVDRIMAQHLVAWGALALAIGIGINAPAIHSYLTSGRVYAHWIYILVGGLLVLLGVQCVSFGVLARTLGILTYRRRFANHERLR